MTRAEDKTVMVVDDEPNLRDYLGDLLEDAGFQVMKASEGVEAMEMIRKKRPDFISLDLVMPRKSGHKLLFELKRDRELSRIPVLIVTAHARDDLGEQDMENILKNRVLSGPGVYLEKLVDPRKYVRTVMQTLGIDPGSDEEEPAELRNKLKQSIKGASPEALLKAIEILKNKKGA
jgi:CheY-like chemotaxis protein